MVNSAGDYVVSFIVSRYVDGKAWLQKQLAKKAEADASEAKSKHTFSAGVPCSREHRRLCPLTPEKFLGFHIFPVSHFCAFYLFWDNFAE